MNLGSLSRIHSSGQAKKGKRHERGELSTCKLRIGLGEDTHRLAEGGPLRLGGIDVSHDRHSVGHSDADVLLHAVTDAVLGAAGLGDIGQLFPDHDPANKDRDSAEMLRSALGEVSRTGYSVVNLDCVIAAQEPKIAPHKTAIRQRIAAIMSLEPSQVNLKAKTGEGIGPVGQQEIIEARCIALLEKIE